MKERKIITKQLTFQERKVYNKKIIKDTLSSN